MNENAKKWVEVLKSDRFKQARHVLHNVDEDSYCCLGVACQLAIEAGVSLKQRDFFSESDGANITAYGDNDNFTSLPEEVQNWLGLDTDVGMLPRPNDITRLEESLAGLNDTGKTFADIAAIIESEPEGLFKNVTPEDGLVG